MTTELLDLICTINISKQYAWTGNTSKLNTEHETCFFSIWTDHIIRSVKYGCRLHTYCEPRANKKCTKYNSVTILFESRSRCRPLRMREPLTFAVRLYTVAGHSRHRHCSWQCARYVGSGVESLPRRLISPVWIRIAKIRKCLDTAACKTLVHSLVTSRIDYGNAVLYGISDRLLHRLEMVRRPE